MAESSNHIASPLKALADQVSQQTAALSKHLASRNLQEPSFATSTSTTFLSDPEEALQNIRLPLIEACQALLELVSGPDHILKFNVPVSIQFNSALAVTVRFHIAENVPTGLADSITFEELAERVHLHVDRIIRILRCTIAHRVFEESPIGHVRHNAASRMLLVPGMKAWLGHQFEEMLPASNSLARSFEMYPTADSDRETAFSVAHTGDGQKTYWEVLEQTPGKVKRFCDALEYVTASSGPGDFRPLIACYDWKQYGACTLVDVGGSSGRVSACIAQYADPGMRFIVQDLPEVEAEALVKIKAAGMADRITFHSHDFFHPQPTMDAKVYVYRQILHDWPDQMAIDVLRAAIPAMHPGDHILLIEAIQPPPGTLPNPVERLVRATDLLMMAKHNAKERTLEMWSKLLKDADTRFTILGVTTPDGYPEGGSIIDVGWQP